MKLDEYIDFVRNLRNVNGPVCLILSANDFRWNVIDIENLRYTNLDVALSDKVIVLDHKANGVIHVLKERDEKFFTSYKFFTRPSILCYN